MKPKAICKTAVDFIMTVLLLLLMAYMLIGQKTHEWFAGESSELSESLAPAGENKALLVYFSRVGVTTFDDSVDVVSTATLNIRDGKLTGNMEILAGYIVEATGADLFQRLVLSAPC